MSFKTGRKTSLLLTFLPYFAASANELYIFSTMYVYCVHPAMSKQLPPVTLQVLYKLKTAKIFEKPKKESQDDDPFAVYLIYLCPESRTFFFLLIQTNSFMIFTCPNPVLLVPCFGPVGYHEDWDNKR
jgi:hypothetical protein